MRGFADDLDVDRPSVEPWAGRKVVEDVDGVLVATGVVQDIGNRVAHPPMRTRSPVMPRVNAR